MWNTIGWSKLMQKTHADMANICSIDPSAPHKPSPSTMCVCVSNEGDLEGLCSLGGAHRRACGQCVCTGHGRLVVVRANTGQTNTHTHLLVTVASEADRFDHVSVHNVYFVLMHMMFARIYVWGCDMCLWDSGGSSMCGMRSVCFF